MMIYYFFMVGDVCNEPARTKVQPTPMYLERENSNLIFLGKRENQDTHKPILAAYIFGLTYAKCSWCGLKAVN